MFTTVRHVVGFLATVTLTAGIVASCANTSKPQPVRPDQDSVYAPVVAAMTEEISTLMEQSGTVGMMIALVDGDTPIWVEGFGYADRNTQQPVTTDTKFHIGSVSKTMTAVAVMQLVEEGKVDLDAPFVQYVPEFSLRDPAATQAITVRSVLDHHSGIPGDVFNGMFTYDGPNPDYRPWLLNALATLPPEHAVNEVWAYNNSGYVLLANLVENVSGMSFVDYTREKLFEPMDMPTTGFDDAAVPADQLTSNYSVDIDADGNLAAPEAQPREYINGYAAGSVTSSASEMVNYLRMLLADGQGAAGQVLPAGTLQSMWTPQVQTPLDNMPNQMGIGFLLGSYELDWAGDVVWHNGAATWNFSNMQVLPESDLAVFVSVNTESPLDPVQTIAVETLGMAYTAKTGIQPPADATLPAGTPAPLDEAFLSTFGGKYASGENLDQITSGSTPNTITYTSAVGTPQEQTLTLQPLDNGWLSVEGRAEQQIRFSSVEGRSLMFVRVASGPAIVELTQGEQIPDQQLSPIWQSRVGTYVPTDEFPRNVEPMSNPTMTLLVNNGVLMLQTPSEVGTGVLLPASESEAFTYGIAKELGRNKGDLVQFSSDGKSFSFLGVTYERQGE